MKPGIRRASVLVGAGLLLMLAWLLLGGVGAAVAAPAAPAAATGTPTTAPTVLPTPTSIVVPQDTVAPAGPQMTSFVLAATLTCGATVVALIIAAVSLMLLMRGGYGPFLRTLVYGPQGRGAGSATSAEDDYFPSRGAFGADDGASGTRRAGRSGRSGRRAPGRSRRRDRD